MRSASFAFGFLILAAAASGALGQRIRLPKTGDIFSTTTANSDCTCQSASKRKFALDSETATNERNKAVIDGWEEHEVTFHATNIKRAYNPSTKAFENNRHKNRLRDIAEARGREQRRHDCKVAFIEQCCPRGGGKCGQPSGIRTKDDTTGGQSGQPLPEPQADSNVPKRGYWDGFGFGMEECKNGLGELASRIDRAITAMKRSDFRSAAEILGASKEHDGARAVAAMLQAVWDDLNSNSHGIVPGAPLMSDWDRGRQGAQRVCMYALLPTGGKCVMSGTACAVRGTIKVCRPVIGKIQSLRKVARPRLPPPPSPILRGLLLEDQKFLQEIAATEGKVFIVRDSYRLSMRWVGRDGYKPKPVDVKGKTLKAEDLPPADREKYAGLASAKGLTVGERNALEHSGYKIGSVAEHKVIRGPKGEMYYSDTDLHGVYNLDGTNGWSDALFQKLQCRFFDRGIQHGPHDNWEKRNDPVASGGNYGPQVGPAKPLTAIMPDGSMYWIRSLSEMKAFYRSIGVDFKRIYPNH